MIILLNNLWLNESLCLVNDAEFRLKYQKPRLHNTPLQYCMIKYNVPFLSFYLKELLSSSVSPKT